MSEKGLELLAPAGNASVFKAVIDAGADAVYFGGPSFGARAYAGNLTLEESDRAISYAHLFHKKAYLTVNTLLKNREMENLYPYLKEYYEMGVDGVLVQDLGVLSFIREFFPEFPVHSSTQMTVMSAEGVRALMEKGVSRVVLPRELSLSEIQKIYEKTGMELEAFVHGALCISYSGQCLMSSFLGGRSGNRGRCAQPCRLPYHAENPDGQTGDYLLSPRDFCLIRHLRELDQAGVYSLKIEGRMKSLDYAVTCTSVYRKAIDCYLSNPEKAYDSDGEDEKILSAAGSRNGFTDLYLTKRNGPEMMSFSDSSHERTLSLEEKEPSKISIDMSCRIRKGHPASLTVRVTDENCRLPESSRNQYVTVSGDTAEAAKNAALTRETVEKQLRKVHDTPFVLSGLSIDLEDGCFLTVHSLKELRRRALSALENQLSKEPVRSTPEDWDESKLLSEPAHPMEQVSGEKDRKRTVYISIRNREQLLAVSDFLSGGNMVLILPPESLMEEEELRKSETLLSEFRKEGGHLFLNLPEVLRLSEIRLLDRLLTKERRTWIDGFRVSSLDGLQYLKDRDLSDKDIIASDRLYGWSDISVSSLRRGGFSRIEFPAELSYGELCHRDNRDGILPLYGRKALMLKADCTHKNLVGCDHHPGLTWITDRKGIRFPVLNRCSVCTNYVFNSLPTSLLGCPEEAETLNPAGYGIFFTLEDREHVSEVMNAFQAFLRGASGKLSFETTRGHFRKGVL